MSDRQIQGLLTVDLEDWYHANYDAVDSKSWDHLESTVVPHTKILLEIFREAQVRATFFALGCVADRHRALLREIRDEGHEIASHGYGHMKVSDLGPEGFREDLRRAGAAIEAACGVRPRGFRAPSWSISPQIWKDEGNNFWPIRVLREEGFEYDASLFPFRTYLYGVAGAPRRPHRITLPGQEAIYELPASVAEFFGMRFPFGGGFYFRLLPLPVIKLLGNSYVRAEQAPFMFYLHPREISERQPRLKLGAKERFIHYYNLKSTKNRLQKLLRAFRFGPIEDYLKENAANFESLR